MLPLRAARGVSRPSTLTFLLLLLQPARHTVLRPPALLAPRRLCSSTSAATSGPLPKPPADHRTLGVQQELFTTSIYSPGTPILLPNGARVFNRLVDFLRRQYVRYGFQEVITPTIYKKSLWAKSGHLDNYADDMFTVTSRSPRASATAAATTQEDRHGNSTVAGEAADGQTQQQQQQQEEEEEEEYGLKPMNCPGHCLIFAARRHSYRDLPIRLADFSPLHRNEVSGALTGLTRVRRFHQDDGHIFCRPVQIEAEILQTLDFVRLAYSVFRLGPYRLALSTRPAHHYIGTPDEWAQAESALRRALDASGQAWVVNEGDGAFYGPKIDVILTDSDGREHQTATIQLDFQLPKRFELEYLAPAPELEQRGQATTDPDLLASYGPVRPVLIHRAVLGSVERLMALLIEHYDGKWPFWLNPRQVILLTVNDSAEVLDFVRRTRDVLAGIPDDDDRAGGSRPHPEPLSQTSLLAVDVDDSARSVGLKVREAKTKGYGVVVVVGPQDVAKGTVTVDASGIPGLGSPGAGATRPSLASMSPQELLAFLQAKIDSYT